MKWVLWRSEYHCNTVTSLPFYISSIFLKSKSSFWIPSIRLVVNIIVSITRLSKASVKSILLYGADSWTLTKSLSKRIDGIYTRLLRKMRNISWKAHLTNTALNGSNPRLTTFIQRRRLALAGHAVRLNEQANKALLWKPHVSRK